MDICNADAPFEDTTEGKLEVGEARTPTSMVRIDTIEDIPTISLCPSATTSFGVVFHQDTDRAWRDPLDQRYERIEPSQPGEKERYVPTSIVEDCMKHIDKIVWQLDLGDLEKPFDINDREVRITTRTGPATRPWQTSSGPIWKLNLTTLIAPTPTSQPTKTNRTKEPHLLGGNPSTSDKGKASLKPIVFD